MLSLLHIENMAVIESADITFGPGLNALTGETGAGKSIVVDAMGAVTGGRVSRDLMRTGAKGALVSGCFTDVAADLPWFAENGFTPDETGELVLQRQIMADGRTLCRVSGRPVTVTQLRTLGRQLLNIHGQHDGQQLLDETCHLGYLDRFGKTGPLLSAYREAYQALCALDRKMTALRLDEAEKARKLDLLQYQISELEQAGLRVGEEAELCAQRALLRRAADLLEAVQRVHYALSGDDDSLGAVNLLTDGERALESVAGVSAKLDALQERLKDCRCQLQDVADTARDLAGHFDWEPGELDRVEERLHQIYRLKKKYGASEEAMLNYLRACQEELDEIQFADDRLVKLRQEYESLLKKVKAQAEDLSNARKAAGKALQKRVQEELTQLDMPKVRFETAFERVVCALGLNENGMDAVRFLMSANPGEQVKPIHKIASGGELARIMLALKNVLAEDDGIGTLVFDEVDSGVSGRAAQKVAEKLAQVARHKQVLCVTHLPQLAAMADIHFSVEKGERAGRTFTAVKELTWERRQAELARLTSGEHVGQAALDSAGELLDAAERYKRSAQTGQRQEVSSR